MKLKKDLLALIVEHPNLLNKTMNCRTIEDEHHKTHLNSYLEKRKCHACIKQISVFECKLYVGLSKSICIPNSISILNIH